MASVAEMLLAGGLVAGLTAGAVGSMTQVEETIVSQVDQALFEQAASCIETVYASYGYDIVTGTDAVLGRVNDEMTFAAAGCVEPLTGVDADVLRGDGGVTADMVDALLNL